MIRFASLAAENLDVADDLLGAVSQPIKVDKEVVSGDSPSLDVFAIAVAATITLMFVTVLLVAGSLALEREENAFRRLVRGLVSPTGLLIEKIALGIVASLLVTLLMLAGLQVFVDSTGAASPSGSRRSSPAAPASPPSARRSAAPPGRSAPPRCSPSWSRCRSPSSRWCRRGRSAPASST